jgi:hypothetical protein
VAIELVIACNHNDWQAIRKRRPVCKQAKCLVATRNISGQNEHVGARHWFNQSLTGPLVLQEIQVQIGSKLNFQLGQ